MRSISEAEMQDKLNEFSWLTVTGRGNVFIQKGRRVQALFEKTVRQDYHIRELAQSRFRVEAPGRRAPQGLIQCRMDKDHATPAGRRR
jgi:hypothetical protein